MRSGRHIKLEEILNKEYKREHGDYIQVSTVWSSGIPTNNFSNQFSRFIFSDGEVYIAGILFFKDGEISDARNVCRMLKEQPCGNMLTKFQVKASLAQHWWVLRGQSKHIVLSPRIRDLAQLPVTLGVPSTFSTYSQQPFPFRFTALDQIDSCCVGELVDVLVYSTEVSETEKTRKTGKICKRMFASSVRSKNPNKTGFEKLVTIFGDWVKVRLSKNTVYAFYNVMVDDWQANSESNIKSLHTTGNTVILKINDLKDLPSQYHPDDFVLKLLPKKRAASAKGGDNLASVKSSSTQNCQTQKNDDKDTPLLNTAAEKQNLSQVGDTMASDSNETQTNDEKSSVVPSTPTNETAFNSIKISNMSNTCLYNSPLNHQNFTEAWKFSENVDYTNFQLISSLDNEQQNIPTEANSKNTLQSNILSDSNANGKRILPESSTFSRKNTKKLKLSPVPSFMEDSSFDHFYDFIENEEPLKVRKETIRSTFLRGEDQDTYRMQSNPRGIALIINNFHFPTKTETSGQYREGSRKDVEHLSEILTIFKFDVIVKEDISSEVFDNDKFEQLPSVLDDFKAKATNEMDACFVAILSHGILGFVEMVDGKLVPLSKDIIHQFDRKAFPIFAGKPKIFLIQACKNLPTEEDCRHVVIHNKKKDFDLENMIECYATTSGDSAKRDIILGSHFIYVFVDQLMKHAHDTDLVTILTKVQHCLANKIRWDENHKLHCEWTPHLFDRKLYFNPGL